MTNNKDNIISSASHYALILGLFWVFRYLLYMGGEISELSKYVYYTLTIGTPLLLYILLSRYRDTKLEGQISYGQAILFTLLLFGFASLIEAVIVSIHLFIISPEIVIAQNDFIYDFISKMKLPNESMQAIEYMLSFGALYYIFNYILTNMLIGLFLSLILGYIVSRQKNIPPKTSN